MPRGRHAVLRVNDKSHLKNDAFIYLMTRCTSRLFTNRGNMKIAGAFIRVYRRKVKHVSIIFYFLEGKIPCQH